VAGLTEGREGDSKSWVCEVEKLKKRKRRRNRESAELEKEAFICDV